MNYAIYDCMKYSDDTSRKGTEKYVCKLQKTNFH
jgi:hypothetical protein